LKKKGFKEERVTTMGLDDIGISTTLESNKSLTGLHDSSCCGSGRGGSDSLGPPPMDHTDGLLCIEALETMAYSYPIVDG
jgi:hypothetical protein